MLSVGFYRLFARWISQGSELSYIGSARGRAASHSLVQVQIGRHGENVANPDARVCCDGGLSAAYHGLERITADARASLFVLNTGSGRCAVLTVAAAVYLSMLRVYLCSGKLSGAALGIKLQVRLLPDRR